MVYKKLIELIGKFSNGLEFERHDKFGWLTSNLELLGSGLYCKVCLKFKQRIDCIKELCDKLRIKITPINITVENEQIVELISQHTFGVSEFECVKAFYDSIKEVIKTLVECGMQNDTENEQENLTQHETTLENVNESNSQELCENSCDVNNDGDKSKEIEQCPVVEDDAIKNSGNNEQQGDDENIQNEQVSNTLGGNEDKAASEVDVLNEPEASDANENNIDNVAEGENGNEGTLVETDVNLDNNATKGNQNENETNQNEADSPENPNDIADQSAKEAAEEEEVGGEGQSTEG